MKMLEGLGVSPAPWKADLSDEDSAWVNDAQGNDITFLAKYERKNAHLIAAAPDMYEALRKITEEQECGHDCAKCNNHGCVIKECKAALAKAAGEEVANG